MDRSLPCPARTLGRECQHCGPTRHTPSHKQSSVVGGIIQKIWISCQYGKQLLVAPSHPLAGPRSPSGGKRACGTIDTRSYGALGRELDEILAGEVGWVSRMADLMGPSGPNACEAMNLQLYCQTVMLRQNQHGKDRKLKREGFCSSLHPILSSFDSIELHVACIYSKTTNSFSPPCPPP